MVKLTPKQEKFCQKYIELGNASEAYRQSYSCGGMSDNAIAVEASRLQGNPKVSLRIEDIQKSHQIRHEITVDGLTDELEEARQVSMGEGQGGGMVSATMGKAKLHGLLIDKNELTGKNGQPIEVAVTTKDQIKKEIDVLFSEPPQ